MLVVTGEDFISSEQKRKRATDSFKQGEKVVFADLRAGDYVVHRSQGIGIYIGVNTITTADGVTKDYIKIKYKMMMFYMYQQICLTTLENLLVVEKLNQS